MIGIVDYRICNLSSVRNSLMAIGAEVSVTADPDALRTFSHIVLPGVGTFAQGSVNLRQSGLGQAVKARAVAGTPVLGICLGMQLLAHEGDEVRRSEGLDLLPGRVVRIPVIDASVRLPHMGWNSVKQTAPSALWRGIPDESSFYFVHSYAFDKADDGTVTGTTTHGVTFPVSLQRDNIFGVQFHPEKSQKVGLQVLRNFVSLC